MLRVINVISAVVIAGTVSGLMNRGFKVIQGEEVTPWTDNPFKFMVWLHGKTSCTGSIFNQRILISAAHCFMNETTRPDRVTLKFVSKLVQYGPDMKIYHVCFPETYQKKFHSLDMFGWAGYRANTVNGDDIAIIKLTADISIQQLDLATLTLSTAVPTVGAEVIVVGYGNFLGQDDGNIYLKSGNMQVVQCTHAAEDDRICARPIEGCSKQAFEIGDSGQPLMIERAGQYIVSGFASGEVSNPDGSTEHIFASYRRHDIFFRDAYIY